MPLHSKPVSEIYELASNFVDKLNRKVASLNPSLLPFTRAYLVGYVTSTLPTILKIIISYITRNKGRREFKPTITTTISKVIYALVQGFHIRGFAMFAGLLMGVGHYLQGVFYPRILVKIQQRKKKKINQDNELSTKDLKRARIMSVFSANAVASTFAMWYLHRMEPSSRISTIDLTLLAMVRAIDVLARIIYQDNKSVQKYIPIWLVEHADTTIFSLSCLEIMFAWFMEPSRLPVAYNIWISKTAQLDPNFIILLRKLFHEEVAYGQYGPDTGLLRARAIRLGMPAGLGDLALVEKVPCELYHGRIGGNSLFNCELHGLWRWCIGFKNALKIYIPVFLIPAILFKRRHLLKDPIEVLSGVVKGSARSSAFLATFITIIYYSVCTVRSRFGPLFFPHVPRGTFDKFWAPFVGCCLCGLSVLIESKHRRGEMALYVAPRALFAFYERMRSSKGTEQRILSSSREALEITIFASSMGIVMAALKERPRVLRGVVKGFLRLLCGPENQTEREIKGESAGKGIEEEIKKTDIKGKIGEIPVNEKEQNGFTSEDVLIHTNREK